MDFHNASAERGEAFLAWVKRILLGCTNRNLATDQPLREVFIRHGVSAITKRNKKKEASIVSQIKKAFKGHEFNEVGLDSSLCSELDCQIFLNNLERWGYKEGTDWITLSNTITFITVEGMHQQFPVSNLTTVQSTASAEFESLRTPQ
ncbi:hypothetical protein QOT17_016272 [Balamuthia mandrillaris]